jgi:hypothetical protein
MRLARALINDLGPRRAALMFAPLPRRTREWSSAVTATPDERQYDERQQQEHRRQRYQERQLPRAAGNAHRVNARTGRVHDGDAR